MTSEQTVRTDRSRRWRGWRLLLIVLAAIILLTAGGLTIFLATFDPSAYRPLIERQASEATGRALTIKGPIGFTASLWPSIVVSDLALANPPGFPATPMLTVQRAELQLGLLPLLSSRIEIRRLLLVGPQLSLLTDAQGSGNWTRPPPPPPPPSGQPPASGPAAAAVPSAPVAIAALSVRDGQVAWRDAGGRQSSVAISRLDLTAPDPAGPVAIAGALGWQGIAIGIDGTLGSLARLQDRAATAPWPVALALSALGARLSVQGSLRQPAALSGYDLRVEATAADLPALQPLIPLVHLPALRDVSAGVALADGGAAGPLLRDAVLRAGAGDLGALLPGLPVQALALKSLALTAPAMDQAMLLHAELAARGIPMVLSAKLGPPRGLWQSPTAPFALDATLTAAGAGATAAGTIARPAALAGVDLAVTLRAPDLAAFSPLLGRPLPTGESIEFAGRLADQGGLAHGIRLSGARLVAKQGDLAGDVALTWSGRPAISGTLAAQRLDWDALAPLLAAAPGGPPPAAAPAAPPPPPAAKRTRLIPDTALPVASLRQADADLRLRAATLLAGGTAYRDVAARLLLKDARLVLDPVTATVPAGRLQLTLSVDANAVPPPVALSVRAPGLALQPLLAALKLPSAASGTLDVDADLHGAGATVRAIAAGLDGRLGLSLVNGEVDNRVIVDAMGPLLHGANLPPELALGAARGRSKVRCLAVRLDAAKGNALVRALVLDADKLRVIGAGSIDLADEALALKLRPELKWSGTGIVVPVLLGGTLAAPSTRIDPAGAADPASPLAAIAGVLAGRKLPALNAADPCPAALALARSASGAAAAPANAPAPVPAPAPGPSPAPSPAKPPKPIDILKQLLR